MIRRAPAGVGSLGSEAHRETVKETGAVAVDLAEESSLVSDIEIGASILFVTDKLPRPDDIDRVRHHLRRDGVIVYDTINTLRH